MRLPPLTARLWQHVDKFAAVEAAVGSFAGAFVGVIDRDLKGLLLPFG
jgi:hypothetical protein